jgi:hypothetical protein
LTGVVAAFVTYIALGVEVHLRIHDGRWVPDAWRAHHLLHHVRPQQNFNIFLPVFDWLLGSKISLFPVRSMSWAQRREYSRRRREKWRNYSEKNN